MCYVDCSIYGIYLLQVLVLANPSHALRKLGCSFHSVRLITVNIRAGIEHLIIHTRTCCPWEVTNRVRVLMELLYFPFFALFDCTVPSDILNMFFLLQINIYIHSYINIYVLCIFIYCKEIIDLFSLIFEILSATFYPHSIPFCLASCVLLRASSPIYMSCICLPVSICSLFVVCLRQLVFLVPYHVCFALCLHTSWISFLFASNLSTVFISIDWAFSLSPLVKLNAPARTC